MEGIQMQGVDESLAEISKKLLEGWKMLETPCPISNFPLIEKDGKVYSVRCQMDVVLTPSLSGGGDAGAGAGAGCGEHTASTVVPEGKSRQVFRLLRMGFKLSPDKCPVSGGPLFVKGDEQFSLLEDRMLTAAGAPSNDPNADPDDAAITEVYNNADNTGLPASGPSAAAQVASGSSSSSSSSSAEPDLGNIRLRLLAWETNKDAWTQRLSARLLQGWKMLNEPCPVTGAVPLMEGKNGERYSPATDCEVDGLTGREKEELARGIVRQFVTDKQDTWHRAVQALAAKGWLALHGQCDPLVPSVPLLQNPDGDVFSVVLERALGVAAGDGGTDSGATGSLATAAAPVSAASAASAAATTGGGGKPADASSDESEIPSDDEGLGAYDQPLSQEEREKRDGWSRELSGLMLKGWRMLSEHCPETGAVPLMQPRGETRRYSVATGKFYDEDDNEVREDGGAAAEAKQGVGATAAGGAAVAAAAATAPLQAATEQQRLQQQQPAPNAAAASQQSRTTVRPAPAATAAATSAADDEHRGRLAAAQNTVSQKIEWLQQKVAVTEDVHQLRELFACLSAAIECSDTIAASLNR